VAVNAREVPIEHDHVVRVNGHARERARAVQHQVDRQSLTPQPL
jgi:hypothetical protein